MRRPYSTVVGRGKNIANMTNEMNGHLDPNTDRIRNVVAALPHSTVFWSEMLVGTEPFDCVPLFGYGSGYVHGGTYTKE